MAVRAEEPPQLLGIEIAASVANGHAGGGAAHTARGEHDRAKKGGRDRAGNQRGTKALPGQGDEHRSEGDHAPLLVGDREAEQNAGPCRVAAQRRKHRRDAEDCAEHLFWVAERHRVVGDGVEDAHDERQGDREPAAARGAQLRRDPHSERGEREQAGECGEAVDEELCPVRERGDQRERRAQLERGPVRRCSAKEGEDVRVQEGAQRPERLTAVVIEGDLPGV